MSANESQPRPSVEQALGLMELIEMALIARGFEYLAERVLPGVSRMMQSELSLLYISDSRLSSPYFFPHGIQPEMASGIEKLCAEQFHNISNQTGIKPVPISSSPACKIAANLMLYPLRAEEICVGILGLTVDKEATSPDILERLLHLLANTINSHVERMKSERQLSNLNKYLTVSSMLAQSIDLHELLEITLQCCMEAVSAEAVFSDREIHAGR